MRIARLAPLMAAFLATNACVTRPGPPDCPASDNWRAAIAPAPDAANGSVLTVVGEVAVPPGHTARLRPGPTDRMMPPGQRFELLVFNDPGQRGGWQEVRGTLAPALPAYGRVIIGCGGETVATIDMTAPLD